MLEERRAFFPVEPSRAFEPSHFQVLVSGVKINFPLFRISGSPGYEDYIEPEMIPEPDYSDSEGDHENRTHLPRHRTAKNRSPTGVHQMDDDGLILPRKLQNPCMESVERQNLHRELLFNQKIGKNPLRQKSELEKVMEKVREEQKKKELEEERLSRRTALEKRLEEQAKKHDETSKDVPPSKEVDSEFLRVHARVRANSLPLDSKS